ncbi:aminomethyltransferase [Actinoplanes campanulatus]|uniref:aminomethyltransferase n=1 Tax=Actinoplanes campanulatus TaxID=113559 RepID=A0A7W5ASI9_9ACTN|nr:glycine cleavage system aminomethyltransferase GcvT [Actinoplanes campanulatus]MBB3101541.1 aminomethyltransferase [Actinoplanes campanulatus]GGN51923.1 aminomethyltransferase [Actinoplanes campanulatus]GID42692.1 aminomethyltransferase [Actinoplanes campanulatus]
MRRTALFDTHSRLGAAFTDFAGWSMPLRYGSDLAEHHTVRDGAGLFDLSHMGRIRVSGDPAFLDWALVGRMSAVKVGRAKYTMLCHTNGGVLDDLVVYRLAEREFMVVANAANAAVVRAMLGEHSNGYDVRVDEQPGVLIAVQGPMSLDVLGTGADLPYYGIRPDRLDGREVLLARTGYTGEDGFEIYCSAGDAPAIWEWAAARGARPCGLACRDTLRLEAGMPLYGHELSVRSTPFHAGLGRVVALDKPDFVGAAALRSVAAAGPETLLAGLVTEGRRAPRAGYRVLHEGTDVGVVTSGALSPTLGHPVAMAQVTAALAEPGTKLAVDIRGTRVDAEVVALPFYRRAR